MAQDMVQATDLAGFRGAPFPQPVMDSAVGAIRDECGWHIAPSQEDTFTMRTGRVETILLPSLHITEVVAVNDLTSSYAPVIPPDRVDILDHGALHLEGGWPAKVSITIKHGYATCPDSLKAIIAEQSLGVAAGRIRQESLAGRSLSLEAGLDPMTDTVLSRYRLDGRI
ncbi:hypothetical protein AB0K08_13575 [Citricoccus sp. NPDC055426]|uniref:hypothetical protein n=1 Tax=Citricoccus sp. NPDC055426 TaxID=3155536 RepID=UPI00343B499C